MPGKRLDQDKHLGNSSVIFWSRREDPYVPVKCGKCKQERLILSENCTRKAFDGICRHCCSNEARTDVNLPNGCVVYWSRRKGYRVPLKCGKCGREWVSYAQNIRKPQFTGYCHSCAHTGEESNSWKGGRIVKHGYIYVKVYPDHPFYESMANNMGYIAEHRLIVAQSLGKPLTSTEVVHHKNHNKQDNRLENLELYGSFKEHGDALHARMPHAGYIPLNKFKRLIEIAKGLLEKEEAQQQEGKKSKRD